MSEVKLTFLGTGTSQGIPIIGCQCPVCRSADPRDKRLRAAAYVEYEGFKVLIDAGPDFRMQMLAAGIRHLDAILLTHKHKDHTGGLDDVRSFNYIDKKAVEIYCEPEVLKSLRNDYAYAFAEHKYPGAPEWHVHLIDDKPFRITSLENTGDLEWIHDVGYFYRQPDGSLVPSDNAIVPALPAVPGADSGTADGVRYLNVIPIRGYHDQMPVLGFRFGKIAYITDMSSLPEGELAKLKGLDHVSLNTVGYYPHHSHFSLDQALELAGSIGAKHTWLTHLSHAFPSHGTFCDELHRMCAERGIASDVQPAYDGLTVTAP